MTNSKINTNNKYDLIILGAGAAGLSCANLLASAIKMYDLKKSVLVLDNNKSDILKAKFFNASGLPYGENGDITIDRIKNNIQEFSNIEFLDCTIESMKPNLTECEIFTNQNSLISEKVVIALGFKNPVVNHLGVEVTSHPKIQRQDRYAIPNNNLKISDNIYVCGSLAGKMSQYAIAAGTGAEVAMDILYSWTGEWKHVHDKISKDKIVSIEINKKDK